MLTEQHWNDAVELREMCFRLRVSVNLRSRNLDNLQSRENLGNTQEGSSTAHRFIVVLPLAAPSG